MQRNLRGLFRKDDVSFSHRRDAKLAEKMVFFSGGERPPEKQPSQLFRGKGFMQVSAGGRRAAFYPDASHGRIKIT
jgi:hypothetical protein